MAELLSPGCQGSRGLRGAGQKVSLLSVGIGPIKPTFLTASPKGLQGSQGVRKEEN